MREAHVSGNVEGLVVKEPRYIGLAGDPGLRGKAFGMEVGEVIALAVEPAVHKHERDYHGHAPAHRPAYLARTRPYDLQPAAHGARQSNKHERPAQHHETLFLVPLRAEQQDEPDRRSDEWPIGAQAEQAH